MAMPESGTHTYASFALARTLSRGHTPAPGRKGEGCPRRGNRVGDQPRDFVIEIRVLHSHLFGYETTLLEWRVRGRNRTLLVKHSSVRGIVIRCLVKPVKWGQMVNGKSLKGIRWVHLP